MHQVTEIADVATGPRARTRKVAAESLHRSMIYMCLVLVVGCSQHNGNAEKLDSQVTTRNKSNLTHELRRGLPGEPRTLDAQLADDTYSLQVVRDLYEGLTAEDRNGSVTPGIANYWTVDSAGKIYTFFIRPDAKWSNGDPIVAEDFVNGLQRAVDPATASGSASLLKVIRNAVAVIAGRKKVSELGVTAIDESTLKIELDRPAPFILEILAQPVSAPWHTSRSQDKSRKQIAVTDGPYILVSRVNGSYIELARNPYYWDISHVQIERVRYIDAESEATELREYLAGQLDLTYTLPTPDLDRLTRTNGAELQTGPILGTLYLAINESEPSLRDNHDLRQALSMAIDRDLIAQHITLGVTPAYSFVSKGVTGYEAPSYSWSHWPRERQLSYARELLSRSGYSGKKPLHLTLYFNSGEGIERIMIAVAGSWKLNIGVESTLVSDEFRVFLADRRDRARWDVLRQGWWADYNDPASFLENFTSNSGQNDPAYSSQAFDSLIEEARLEPDQKTRISLLQRSEETLLNDYPIIPIYFYTAKRLVKPYVGGAEISPLNRTYSKHLYWKTERQ